MADAPVIQKTSFFEENPGELSAMRLVSIVGPFGVLGMWVLTGIVGLAKALWFKDVPVVWMPLDAASVAAILAFLGPKAAQKFAEMKGDA